MRKYTYIQIDTMSLDDIKKALSTLGLSEKEIAAYLLLLGKGSAPASAVAKHLGLVRSTGHYLCQQLAERGVLRLIKHGDTHLFSAEPPENLPRLFAVQEHELQEKRKTLEQAVKPLQQMMADHPRVPDVRFYNTRQGVLAAWQEVLDTVGDGGELLSFVHPLEATPLSTDGHVHELFMRQRKQRGITMRLIAADCAAARELQKYDKLFLRETRIVKGMKPTFPPVEMLIFGQKLADITMTKDTIFATVTENRSVSGLMRLSFEALWAELKPTKKKKH